MKRFLSTLSLSAMAAIVFAQSPAMFNYQAVIRDGSGNLMTNQAVDVRIGLYDGASMEYEETHSVTTDDYGLVSVNVGSGNTTSGTFSSLTWESIQYEMKVEVDAGSGYQNLGQAPLASVPYALHAGSVPNMQLDGLSDVNAGSPSANEVLSWDGSNWVPSSPSMDLNDLNDVNAGSPAANEVLKWNGTNWTPQTDNAGSGSVWNTSGGVISYSAGNVGINTTSPSEALDVNGNVELGDTINFGSAERIYDGGAYEIMTNSDLISDGMNDLGKSANPWGDIYVNDVNTTDIYPTSNNEVTIQGKLDVSGDTLYLGNVEFYETGSFQIEVNGAIDPELDGFDDLGSVTHRWDEVYATNGTIQTSDRRDKTNIRTLDYGLEELMALKPVRFQWKDRPEQGDKLGLIAQDLQKVINEVVKDHDYERTENGSLKRVENERLGVYYSDLIPVLIKAMQEQQEQIKALETQNKELQELRNELDALKQQIKNLK